LLLCKETKEWYDIFEEGGFMAILDGVKELIQLAKENEQLKKSNDKLEDENYNLKIDMRNLQRDYKKIENELKKIQKDINLDSEENKNLKHQIQVQQITINRLRDELNSYHPKLKPMPKQVTLKDALYVKELSENNTYRDISKITGWSLKTISKIINGQYDHLL
jgi:chromosome segregation ATPase